MCVATQIKWLPLSLYLDFKTNLHLAEWNKIDDERTTTMFHCVVTQVGVYCQVISIRRFILSIVLRPGFDALMDSHQIFSLLRMCPFECLKSLKLTASVLAWPTNQSYGLQTAVVANSVNNSVPR